MQEKAALFSHQLPTGKEKTGSTWSLNRVLPAEEESPDSMRGTQVGVQAARLAVGPW